MADRVGSKTIRALLEHFDNNLLDILRADAEELQRVPGIGPKIAQAIRAVDLPRTEDWIHEWELAGVSIITWNDPTYPARLKNLDDAPATLFMRGAWSDGFERAVAIVGTRSPSPEATDIARQASAILARKGYTIVSGLAKGVDTEAHTGALSITSGRTVAVLGGGVLSIYPQENQSLAETILTTGGVLLSEVAPPIPPSSARLVARNRIISGLCSAVIVIETGEDGGAMYAAKRAREQGRAVYAIDNASSGNRALIADGATALQANLADLDSLTSGE
jgi:DNA processing protein